MRIVMASKKSDLEKQGARKAGRCAQQVALLGHRQAARPRAVKRVRLRRRGARVSIAGAHITLCRG